LQLADKQYHLGFTTLMTLTTVHKDEIDTFRDHFNEKNADIQITKEIEVNWKLPFLDCLVSHDNNKL